MHGLLVKGDEGDNVMSVAGMEKDVAKMDSFVNVVNMYHVYCV